MLTILWNSSSQSLCQASQENHASLLMVSLRIPIQSAFSYAKIATKIRDFQTWEKPNLQQNKPAIKTVCASRK